MNSFREFHYPYSSCRTIGGDRCFRLQRTGKNSLQDQSSLRTNPAVHYLSFHFFTSSPALEPYYWICEKCSKRGMVYSTMDNSWYLVLTAGLMLSDYFTDQLHKYLIGNKEWCWIPSALMYKPKIVGKSQNIWYQKEEFISTRKLASNSSMSMETLRNRPQKRDQTIAPLVNIIDKDITELSSSTAGNRKFSSDSIEEKPWKNSCKMQRL